MAFSRARFWLPGLAVTSGNRTYLHDVLFKILVHAPQNAIRAMPFTRALTLPGRTGLIAGNRPETYFHWMIEVAPKPGSRQPMSAASTESVARLFTSGRANTVALRSRKPDV
jgi:hypothetical protein